MSVELPARAADPACSAAATSWPATVAGLQPVPVSPDTPAARGWGEPPVLAICGFEPLGPTALDCISVDGVDWVVLPASDGARFTTYGRAPALDVFVPSRYAPEPLLLPAFTAAARALPETGHRCT